MSKHYVFDCAQSKNTLGLFDDEEGLLDVSIGDNMDDYFGVYLSAEDEEKLRVLLNERKENKE